MHAVLTIHVGIILQPTRMVYALLARVFPVEWDFIKFNRGKP